MKMSKCICLTTAMALAFASAVLACDTKSKKGEKADVKTVTYKDGKTIAAKPGCSKGAKTVANKPSCAKSKVTLAGKARCNKFGGSAAATVLASMPSMTYRVGDFETPCSKTASAKAEETKTDLTFVVDGKTHTERGDAVVALIKLLTERATEMTEVKFVAGKECFRCPISAAAVAKKANTQVKYRLAGFDFNDQGQATKLAKELEQTVSGLKMTFKADGKPVVCCKSAKAAGKTLTYVVGDQETQCETSAKLMLAELVIRTIIQKVAGASS